MEVKTVLLIIFIVLFFASLFYYFKIYKKNTQRLQKFFKNYGFNIDVNKIMRGYGVNDNFVMPGSVGLSQDTTCYLKNRVNYNQLIDINNLIYISGGEYEFKVKYDNDNVSNDWTQKIKLKAPAKHIVFKKINNEDITDEDKKIIATNFFIEELTPINNLTENDFEDLEGGFVSREKFKFSEYQKLKLIANMEDDDVFILYIEDNKPMDTLIDPFEFILLDIEFKIYISSTKFINDINFVDDVNNEIFDKYKNFLLNIPEELIKETDNQYSITKFKYKMLDRLDYYIVNDIIYMTPKEDYFNIIFNQYNIKDNVSIVFFNENLCI